MSKKSENEKEINIKEDTKYSVESILMSKRYSNIDKDIIKSILTKDKEYSLNEIEEELKKFKERKVV